MATDESSWVSESSSPSSSLLLAKGETMVIPSGAIATVHLLVSLIDEIKAPLCVNDWETPRILRAANAESFILGLLWLGKGIRGGESERRRERRR